MPPKIKYQILLEIVKNKTVDIKQLKRSHSPVGYNAYIKAEASWQPAGYENRLLNDEEYRDLKEYFGDE